MPCPDPQSTTSSQNCDPKTGKARIGLRSLTPAVTTSITATVASATTAINAATREAAGAGGNPRPSCAHHEPPPLVFVVIESLDRSLCLGVGVHLDEAEPLAAPQITVLDDLGALQGAERCGPLLQLRGGYRVGQVTHIQFLSHEILLSVKTFRPALCFPGR